MVRFTAKKVSKQRPRLGNYNNFKPKFWSKLAEEQPSRLPWKLHSVAHRPTKTSKANDKANRVCNIFISPIHGQEVTTCLPILLTMQGWSPQSTCGFNHQNDQNNDFNQPCTNYGVHLYISHQCSYINYIMMFDSFEICVWINDDLLTLTLVKGCNNFVIWIIQTSIMLQDLPIYHLIYILAK